MKAKRINEYDVIVTGASEKFAKALRGNGLKVWKLAPGTYQVSFAEREDLRAKLEPVGSEWKM